MKKIILLLAFTVFCLNSKAQITYFHYLDYQTEWRSFSLGFNGFWVGKTYFTQYFDGDSLFSNGKTYYKQYYIRLDSNFSSPIQVTQNIYGPYLLREDSSNKIWDINSNTGIEELNTDWQIYKSYVVGDTITGANCTISQLDSIYFDSKYLTRIKGFTNAVSIEGIGSTGLLCGMGIEFFGELVCFRKRHDSIQFDNAFNCYNSFPKPQRHSVSTGISKIIEHPTLNIFPNPTSNIVTVESSSNQIIKHAMVLDLLGRKIIDVEENSSKISLDLSSLNSSTYILKTQVGNDWLIKKIIKD